MAKKRKRKDSRSASRDVESEMRRYKRGTAKSGKWQGQKPEAGNSDRALESPEKG